ncbi:MAG: hypothetical protein OXN84_19860 [Albidovulum sp.]|nr:hypothetical protein [Albidovulum sp.]
MFDLADDETLERLVDGGEDSSIDAPYFEPPMQRMIDISLTQGKYRKRIDGDSAFTENAIIGMINAFRILFDPSAEISSNERLRANRRNSLVHRRRSDTER